MQCTTCGHSQTTVIHTRAAASNVLRRDRQCGRCQARFSTLEVSADIAGSIRGYVEQNAAAIARHAVTWERNERIRQLMAQGVKQTAIAYELGLTDNYLSILLKQLGLRRAVNQARSERAQKGHKAHTQARDEQIRQRLEAGAKQAAVAQEFGLSHGYLSRLAQRLGMRRTPTQAYAGLMVRSGTTPEIRA